MITENQDGTLEYHSLLINRGETYETVDDRKDRERTPKEQTRPTYSAAFAGSTCYFGRSATKEKPATE
jgi:hypothetical protein